MGRRCLFSLTVLAASAVVAATAAASSDLIHVAVNPATGSPRTHFRVGFKAPASSTSSSSSRRYEVSAAGRSARGCDSSASAALASVHAGEQVHVTLAPAGAARVWCKGPFTGRVEEVVRPVCSFREACPDYIAILTVGRFSFRVRGSASARG